MAYTGGYRPKIMISVNSEAFFWSHRLYLAKVCLQAGYHVVISCPLESEQSKKKFTDLGFEVEPLFMKRHGLDIIGELKLIKSYFSAIKKHRPDIYQGFTVKCNIYGSIVAGLLNTPQIFITLTGLGTPFIRQDLKSRFTRKAIIFLYKYLMPRRTKFIFQNADDRQIFYDQGILKNRDIIMISGTGIDTQLFSPVAFVDRVPRILFPARVIVEKGVRELIEACEELFKLNLKFELWICGSIDANSTGSLGEAYCQHISKLPYVKYLGFQKEMHKVYKNVDIVCMPSYREGIPQSLMEAASCGLPIVTTDVPGCRLIIKSNKNGFLVASHSSKVLVEPLQKLILDKKLRQDMGEESRKIAIEDFCRDKLTQRYLDLYSSTQNQLELAA